MDGQLLDPRLAEYLWDSDAQPPVTRIPSELPLLEDLRVAHPLREVFKGVDVLFIQHHLAPLVPRVRAMTDEGLDLSRCWFVDVPYSTNEEVLDGLSTLGHPPHQRPPRFVDPLQPYASTQMERVEGVLKEIAGRSSPGQFLVLDDGAYFTRALARLLPHHPGMAAAFRGTCVVEQTTYGHRYLKGDGRAMLHALRMSAVSIARCRTKLEFESPFIGASVSRAMLRGLEAFPGTVDGLRRVAVIGFGPVGKATVIRLRRALPGTPMDVIEIDTEKHESISSLGCRPLSRLDSDCQYDLVAGCTGYASFPLSQRSLLADGAVLASGSSAAIEFNREKLIELADASPDDELEVLDRDATRQGGIHATITIRQDRGRRFSFLNSSYPINFDGSLECLTIPAIQPTHCLMVAAARQALRGRRQGLAQIHPVIDEWIYQHALESLADHYG